MSSNNAPGTFQPDQIINQLNQAKSLAFDQPETYAQVYRQILPFVNRQEQSIQSWCVQFIHESFIKNSRLKHADRVDLAIDSLDALINLTNIVKDIHEFINVIEISCITYQLVFQYVAENDGCNQIWSKLTELKNSLVNKFQTNFPLDPSDNTEHDLSRNVATKLELLKFIMIVIDYQSKTQVVGEPLASGSGFSLNRVSPDHSLIKYSNMEYESVSLLNLILKTFNHDIIITPLVSATLNHCIIIMKKKPQYASKILGIIDKYDTNSKLQSNYQSIEQFKLAKKYIDRVIKIFLQHCFKNGLIPSNFQHLNKRIQVLVDRGNDIRKKNIFTIVEPNIKKRKFEGFYNPSKRIKTMDYKNLYILNDLNNELNNFDLTTVPQHILTSMVINALQKVPVPRLSKALEIISDRYTNALESTPAPGPISTPTPPVSVKRPTPQPKTLPKVPVSTFNAPVATQVKSEFNQQEPAPSDEPSEEDRSEEEEEEEEEGYNPEAVYTLPPPKELSFQDKKNHISIIIKNFFNLAKSQAPIATEDDNEEENDADTDINKELTKIAIKSWKKDSWILLLTRLATRGMRTKSSETTKAEDDDDYDIEQSPDDKTNQEMSDMIRQAIFDYFLEDIHSRIDLIIEWMNEEWYSEKVFQEARNIKENKKPDIEVDTPIYNKWADKVLESMINFIEPNDKKIFIRLLSDLPYLNKDLIGKIKSLCFDPARSEIGFLALQFLIMYRPPVKDICVGVLQELSECDQEDVKEEAAKKLSKFK
ncbi:uncharacterized protein J8A68_003144 [[Candida] subhashii]|uniref:Symplekin/Pta1 N-terminal domain-containing protein n=1 Tax=[Candida] subhashii TaxID=561895 RepID=A0A8J5QHV6_9ASCO|nr:uncharacterized protein J8A68_003144 [[Candida] subhashii]KAG7663312.1 hypothetical protein J8A68_003144 [[Candida] subhashii]